MGCILCLARYVQCFGAIVDWLCVFGGMCFSIEVLWCGVVRGCVWVWCRVWVGMQHLCFGMGVCCCGSGMLGVCLGVVCVVMDVEGL